MSDDENPPCHDCGGRENDGEPCIECEQWTCDACSHDAEDDEGNEIGVLCVDCWMRKALKGEV